MKELDKKQAPAISGGLDTEVPVIPVAIPIEEFPKDPTLGTGENDLPFVRPSQR